MNNVNYPNKKQSGTGGWGNKVNRNFHTKAEDFWKEEPKKEKIELDVKDFFKEEPKRAQKQFNAEEDKRSWLIRKYESLVTDETSDFDEVADYFLNIIKTSLETMSSDP